MLLLLSGEGATDIGQPTPGATGICEASDWIPGPMAYFVDREFEKYHGLSALANHLAYFVPKTLLAKVAERLKGKPVLMGKNGASFYRRNAQALGCVAWHLSSQYCGQSVISVLFRDCDGTNTTSLRRWSILCDSVAGEKGGFAAVGIRTGVPMIPRPTSEAWILCALKNRYQNCNVLEALSGNDNSQNDPKTILKETLGYMPRAGDLVRMIEDGSIVQENIKMDSFLEFQNAFGRACGIKDSEWLRSDLPESIVRIRNQAYP